MQSLRENAIHIAVITAVTTFAVLTVTAVTTFAVPTIAAALSETLAVAVVGSITFESHTATDIVTSIS